MSTKLILPTISTAIAAVLFSSAVLAGEVHTSTALEHATAAAAAKDTAGVAAHASEAMKHTGAAKTAHTAHPDVVKHIDESETHLKAAIDTAGKGDVSSAVQHATEAKMHLDAANK